MRKLSQVQKASHARAFKKREEELKTMNRMVAWMDDLDSRDIPLHDDSHSAFTTVKRVREYVRNGTYRPVRIECDECSTEMVSLGEVQMTLPPRSKIMCPGCGLRASVDQEYIKR